MGFFSALIGNAGAVSQESLVKDYGKLLIEGEEIELGFKLIRDVFIFTTKRLILGQWSKTVLTNDLPNDPVPPVIRID